MTWFRLAAGASILGVALTLGYLGAQSSEPAAANAQSIGSVKNVPEHPAHENVCVAQIPAVLDGVQLAAEDYNRRCAELRGQGVRLRYYVTVDSGDKYFYVFTDEQAEINFRTRYDAARPNVSKVSALLPLDDPGTLRSPTLAVSTTA